MTPFPPEDVVQGATNTAPGHHEVISSGNDGSGRLRAEVARALGNAGVSPFEIEDFRIEDVADRLHRAGFRLVVDDDTTAETVAAAVWHSDVLRFADLPASDWRHVDGHERKDYLRIARAAVRALREEQA